MLCEPHRSRHLADELPVGPGLPGRRYRPLQQGQVSLGIDHHRIGFGPQRGRQHDVRVTVRRGVAVGVLGDDQFGGLQPGDHAVAVRDAHHRIGADDPARLDVSAAHPVEHLDGARTDIAADCAGWQPPALLDKRAVGVRLHRSLPGQPGSHVTHLTSAHRVGLTRQRHRAAARTADRAGGQVQIADRIGVPGAMGALVQAHRPAAHPLPRIGDHPCGGSDVGFTEAGDLGDPVRRVVGQEGRHRVPALGVVGDEFARRCHRFRQADAASR